MNVIFLLQGVQLCLLHSKHHQPRLIESQAFLSRHTSACRKRPLPKSSSEVNHEALPYAPSNFASGNKDGATGNGGSWGIIEVFVFFDKNGHTSEKHSRQLDFIFIKIEETRHLLEATCLCHPVVCSCHSLKPSRGYFSYNRHLHKLIKMRIRIE